MGVSQGAGKGEQLEGASGEDGKEVPSSPSSPGEEPQTKRARTAAEAERPSPDDGVTGPRPRRIVLLLIGPPGAGKSTFAARLAKAASVAGGAARSWTVVCQDTASKHGTPGTRSQVLIRAQAYLEQSWKYAGVVVDRTNLSPGQREEFWELAKLMDAEACALVFVVPLHELERRVRERDNHPGGVTGARGVAVLQGMIQRHAADLKCLKDDLRDELADTPCACILPPNNIHFARCDADLDVALDQLIKY